MPFAIPSALCAFSAPLSWIYLRIRADQLLVHRGLAESPARAQALMLAGKVVTTGRRIERGAFQL